MVCNTAYSLCCKNMGRMEGDVVYCSQNAMFVLPRKMLKILYQLCTWSTSVRNVPVYVDAIKKLEAHNTIFTFLYCTIVLHVHHSIY